MRGSRRDRCRLSNPVFDEAGIAGVNTHHGRPSSTRTSGGLTRSTCVGEHVTTRARVCCVLVNHIIRRGVTLCPMHAGPHAGTHGQFIWIMIARFILGVGVGGVYPLAATVAAETASDNKSRGVKVSLVRQLRQHIYIYFWGGGFTRFTAPCQPTRVGRVDGRYSM